MILKLDIGKISPGIYEVHCDGYSGSPTCHESISAALAHYGENIPPDFARFVDVRYHEVSLGTTAVARLAQESELMASELTSLMAAVYEAAEDMKTKLAVGITIPP
ncbi:MAG: hypothetical protein Q7K57_25380 [Burkholderiaceae bacterium]|nr:hypothetical protein [Burkholderiaceae bacterium]